MTQPNDAVLRKETEWLRSCFDGYDVDEKGLEKIARAIINLKAQHTRQCEEMRREIAELKRRTNFTYCAYCGKEFSLDTDNSELKEHTEICNRHPLSKFTKLTAELEQAKKELERVRSITAEDIANVMYGCSQNLEDCAGIDEANYLGVARAILNALINQKGER